MRLLKFLGLFVLVSFAPVAALALPAPMSEQELMDKSDLVAQVRVLAVTCTSVTKDQRPARTCRAISPSSKWWRSRRAT